VRFAKMVFAQTLIHAIDGRQKTFHENYAHSSADVTVKVPVFSNKILQQCFWKFLTT